MDDDFLLDRSRELRQNQTPAEEILWTRLRNHGLDGIKFRRQHVIGRYIGDFFAAEVGLVIELDGISHIGKKDDDRIRDEAFLALGLKVFRVWNNAVYDDLECVLDGIWRTVQELRRAKLEERFRDLPPSASEFDGPG